MRAQASGVRADTHVNDPRDLAEARARLDMGQELEALRGPAGGFNAADICCDRHADDPARVALRHRDQEGSTRECTFAQLRDEAHRFARLLAAAGVSRGDRVAGLLPRAPELLVTILATWRLGAVYQPLFTAFGPKAISYRVAAAGTKVLVTDGANRGKISRSLPVTIVATSGREPGDLDFWADSASTPDVGTADLDPGDPILIMFTSGTTGPAKSLLVPLRAVAGFKHYVTDAIGLAKDDRFWNMADPGWAYGLYYAIIGPLALGFATTFSEEPFTVEGAYRTICALDIDVLAGSPTAYRLMMAEGASAAQAIKGRLRSISSAGEPLGSEVVGWFAKEAGSPIYDHYGQTETGMVACNHHALAHRVIPGTAGLASPGFRIAILDSGLDECQPGAPGVLAISRSSSPMFWFEGYQGTATTAIRGDWYLTGDICTLDGDGRITFLGRADDVITTSGYRVGPFEIETALLEHEAVLECAVVGKADPVRTEIIKAFVVLAPGARSSEDLTRSLQSHVRSRLSAHAYPREIEYVGSLPRTVSGKVQRFALRSDRASGVQVAGHEL
jgi:acetyl-CoA synthetase